MTATEELRRMLDERAVEWWAEDDPEEPAYYFVTKWFANGCEQTYEEIPAIRSRSLKAYCVAPEQAIAATLGDTDATGERHGVAGTCHDMYTDDDEWFACSECNAELRVHEPFGVIGSIHYCPNCGRKVVEP